MYAHILWIWNLAINQSIFGHKTNINCIFFDFFAVLSQTQVLELQQSAERPNRLSDVRNHGVP